MEMLEMRKDAAQAAPAKSSSPGRATNAERKRCARVGPKVMTCTGNGPWVSVADGAGIREIIARRWS
jgi:hypothetical protein